MIKEKLVALMGETDGDNQINLLEELMTMYDNKETVEVTDGYKEKYEELHKRYIKTFLEGVEVEPEPEVEESTDVAEEKVTFDDIFEEVE